VLLVVAVIVVDIGCDLSVGVVGCEMCGCVIPKVDAPPPLFLLVLILQQQQLLRRICSSSSSSTLSNSCGTIVVTLFVSSS
jgi:hypothetical protein